MLRFPERLALPSLTLVTCNQESEPLGELRFILAGHQLMYMQLPWAVNFCRVFVSLTRCSSISQESIFAHEASQASHPPLLMASRLQHSAVGSEVIHAALRQLPVALCETETDRRSSGLFEFFFGHPGSCFFSQTPLNVTELDVSAGNSMLFLVVKFGFVMK